MAKLISALNVAATTSSGTLAVRDGATDNMFLKCTSAATGSAAWDYADIVRTEYVYWVATNGNDTTGTGTLAKPYVTIQKALDQITVSTPVTSAEARRVHVIKVAPGTYDESPSVDIGGKHIIIHALGSVCLGTFGGSSWAPTGTARNFSVTCSRASVDSIRWSFAIVSDDTSHIGTHQAYISNFRISGSLVLSNSTGGNSGECNLRGVSLFGWDGVANGNSDSFTATGWAGNLNLYWTNVRCYGAVTGVGRMQLAEACRFEKLLTVATYSQLNNCEIQAGMTWTVAPSEVPPIGIKGCALAGTFTGASSSNLLVDGVSQVSFQSTGATVANGAVLQLIDPSSSVTAVYDRVVATVDTTYAIADTSVPTLYILTPTNSTTVTLPALAALSYGRMLTIVNTSAAYPLIVAASGTDKIFNASTSSVRVVGTNMSISLIGGDAANKTWFCV